MSVSDRFHIDRDGITLLELGQDYEVIAESMQANMVGYNKYALLVIVKVRKRHRKK